jgi:hypothetical protein
MAESRNSFIKSKMNRDLDARLVPPGEYREALNVSVSKSEGADVGSLENILGNISLTDFGLTSTNIDVIGFFMDINNNRIFLFMTNYVDNSSDQLSRFAPAATQCYICLYDISNSLASILVSGNFLNFSKTHSILGVNFINERLFFTDNRNQPRKINVSRALGDPTYYTNEDQISLAKYYPYEPISLVGGFVTNISVSGPAGSGYVPDTNLQTTGGTGSGLTVNITSSTGGIEINNPGFGYTNGDIIVPVERTGSGTGPIYTLVVEEISTMQDVTSEFLPDGTTANPYYNPNWPGDKNYLRDKFIRFAYRFQYDDGEYSLISPFTQACFIPQQDGYFIDKDTEKTYKSTEVEFMQNKVNNIKLLIPVPAESTTWSNALNDLRISSIDIIFKDDSQTTLKVIETVNANSLISNNTTIFLYEYQAKKPFKTLPTRDLLRVSDQVPVRALAQESVGNRIVFGNLVDKHTPPSSINYNTQTGFKVEESGTGAVEYSYVRREYQNHTLKQNRNYQVALVLSDKYGRQSDAILSTVDSNSQNAILKGSTIFNPYKSGDLPGNPSGGAVQTAKTFSYYSSPTDPALPLTNNLFSGAGDTWPGDQLQVKFNETISSNFNSATGTPGLFSATNPTGWYSYKVVVKQTQVDYYNVYCPGVLNGYIDGETANPLSASLEEPVAHFVLHSDNLSKIPKDTSLVGPNQNLFRTARPSFNEDPDYYQFTDTSGNLFQADPYSEEDEQLLKTRDRERDLDSGSQVNNASVELFGRVVNSGISSIIGINSNQYYPGETAEVVTAIGTGSDLGLFAVGNNTKYPFNTAPVFYNYEQNPFIARLNVFSAKLDSEMQLYGMKGPSPEASEYVVEFIGMGSSGTAATSGAGYSSTGGSGVPVVFNGTTATDVKFKNRGIQIEFTTTGGAVDHVVIQNEGGPWDNAGIALNGSIEATATIEAAGTTSADFRVKVTRKALGTHPVTPGLNDPLAMTPIFSCFETNPLDSKLDIYWETSTSGKISDLNANIVANDQYTPYGFRGLSNYTAGTYGIEWGFLESNNINDDLCFFYATDVNGNPISTALGTLAPINPTMTLLSATNSASTPIDVTSDFALLPVPGFPGAYKIQNTTYKFFGYNSALEDVYNFTIRVVAAAFDYNTSGTLITTDLALQASPSLVPGTLPSQPTFPLSNLNPTFTITSYGPNVSVTTSGCPGRIDVFNTTNSQELAFNFDVENGTNSASSDRGKDLSFAFSVLASPGNNLSVAKTYFSTDYVNGGGSTGGKFFVNKLAYPDLGKGPHEIYIRITDGGGLFAECTVEIDLS